MRIGQYTKSIVMILAAGLAILTTSLSDGLVTPVEYVTVAIAIVTAVGVYLVPNLPAGPASATKFWVALAGAAGTALTIVVSNLTSFGEIAASDWMSVLLAGLAAVGLYILPNTAAVPLVQIEESRHAL